MIEASYTEPRPVAPVPEFPYLAKIGGLIIMVTDESKIERELSGFVISNVTSSAYKIGHFCTSWNADEFKRWDGSITLTNKKAF